VIALWQDPTPEQAGDNFGNVERVHPVMLGALAVLALLVLVLPRRLATWPIVLLLCFVPAGQRFVLTTIDFPFLRLLMLAAWGRLFFRGEIRPLVWNRLDRLLLLWAVVTVTTGTLHAATLTAFLNRFGTAVDALSVYFFFRNRFRTPQDVGDVARQFLLCSFAVLGFMLYEHETSRNLFGIFGGRDVPEITDIRDGRLRCQGAFAHPILAGCFYAALLPLYAVLGCSSRRWRLVVAGSAAAVAITVLTASSTPMIALLTCAAGVVAYPFRSAMRYVRWLAAVGLVFLHFSMKQPVWHLLARIDIAGGSTGWHRFHLVDKWIEHFDEWWLLGTLHTGQWGAGLQDVTNQYVAEGVSGGMPRLCVFLLIIATCFQGVSRTMRLPQLPRARAWATWALGTGLFVHCMNYVGVSYFEQIMALWFLTLAAIGSLTLVPGAMPARQIQAEIAIAAAT